MKQSCNECHKESIDKGELKCFYCGSENVGLFEAKKEECPHEDNITYIDLANVDGDAYYLVKCESCGEYGSIQLEEGTNIWGMTKETGLDFINNGGYRLTTNNPLDIPVSSAELQSTLDFLLDIAEKYHPNYSSDDSIMVANDFYKKHLG